MFFVIVFFLNKFCGDYERKICLKKIRDLSFNGIVVEKYIDKKEHDYQRIRVQENGIVQKVNLTNDQSGLFKYLQVNDSVNKITGYLNVAVHRDSKDSIFVINKLCY